MSDTRRFVWLPSRPEARGTTAIHFPRPLFLAIVPLAMVPDSMAKAV